MSMSSQCVLSGAMGVVIKSADHSLSPPWIHYSLNIFLFPCISTYPKSMNRLACLQRCFQTVLSYRNTLCMFINLHSNSEGLLGCVPTEKHWQLFKNVLSSSLHLGHLNYHHFPLLVAIYSSGQPLRGEYSDLPEFFSNSRSFPNREPFFPLNFQFFLFPGSCGSHDL